MSVFVLIVLISTSKLYSTSDTIPNKCYYFSDIELVKIYKTFKKLDNCSLSIDALSTQTIKLGVALNEKEEKLKLLDKERLCIEDSYQQIIIDNNNIIELRNKELESCRTALDKATKKSWFTNLGQVKILGIKLKHISNSIILGGAIYAGYKFK